MFFLYLILVYRPHHIKLWIPLTSTCLYGYKHKFKHFVLALLKRQRLRSTFYNVKASHRTLKAALILGSIVCGHTRTRSARKAMPMKIKTILLKTMGRDRIHEKIDNHPWIMNAFLLYFFGTALWISIQWVKASFYFVYNSTFICTGCHTGGGQNSTPN